MIRMNFGRLLACVALALAVPAFAQTSVSAPARKHRAARVKPLTQEQAIERVEKLPESHAWSGLVHKQSPGHHALIGGLPGEEEPEEIEGVRYFTVRFMEDNGMNYVTLQIFKVRVRDGRIFAYSVEDDALLTLSEWRRREKPLERFGSPPPPPAASAPARGEADPADPIQLGAFTALPAGEKSAPGGIWSTIRVRIELKGSPGADAQGRTLTLTVRRAGSEHANQPPLYAGARPALDLDEHGDGSAVFEFPYDGDCGHLFVTFDLSGPPHPEKKSGVIILECR
jgi:hypothetical protein